MSMSEFQMEGDLPKGKYTFVGLDIDTTGKRILDEIVHLAAYSPTDEFDQYIIPVMNLNPAARQRHRMRVITVGFFRMIKCTLTNKVVKCKTEIVAVKSFMEWLEERKAADTDSEGIVLIYHEPIKFIPYMLLEALKKYDLMERFSKVVAGFVDGHAFAEAKCEDSEKSSLIDLAKAHLDYKEDDSDNNFEGNAMVRARLAYKLLEHFGNDEDSEEKSEITAEMVNGFVHSLKFDMHELTNQNKCMDLQQTFRPVFVQFFKTNLYHRYKAVTFRRVLAENGFDLKSLEDIWNEQKKDGLTEIISKLDAIKEEFRPELADILDSYFDPEKEPIVPIPRSTPRRRPSFKKRSNKENRRTRKDKLSSFEANNNNDMLATPDSTTESPTKNGRRRSRRRLPVDRQLSKSSDSSVNPLTTQLPHSVDKPIVPEITVN